MDDYFYVSTYVVDSYMDMLRKLDCIDQRCAGTVRRSSELCGYSATAWVQSAPSFEVVLVLACLTHNSTITHRLQRIVS